MAAWIELSIHPEHPKIQRAAELTGVHPHDVYCSVLRWLLWLDAHCTDGQTGIGEAAFHRICEWKRATSRMRKRANASLFSALQDPRIDWINIADDGTIIATRFEAHFSHGARKRAIDRRRKRNERRGASTSGRTKSGQKVNKKRTLQAQVHKEEASASSSSAAAPPSTPRKRTERDELWDAVVAEWFASGLTDADRSRIGKIVKGLLAKGAKPEDIPDRRERYRQTWPDAADTPEAVLKHWDQFSKPPPGKPGRVAAKKGKYDAVPVIDAG